MLRGLGMSMLVLEATTIIAVVAMVVQQPRRACREAVTDGHNDRYRTVTQVNAALASREYHFVYYTRNGGRRQRIF